MSDHYAVLDVGKTHAKISVLDQSGEVVFARRSGNRPLYSEVYTALNIDGIWEFFIQQLRQVTRQFKVKAITTATHGAAAVLLDNDSHAPILPAVDYEFDEYAQSDYDALRPDFAQTLSPNMPMGLNLGRQIHYQLGLLSPERRARVSILLYPNYWAWRLTGVQSTEITSLGCHTDLWNLAAGDYSDLVDRLGIRKMFPPLKRAFEPLAAVSAECARQTGLGEDCLVFPGMHDSNAGYYPHLSTPPEDRPTILSTGTWSIAMSAQTPLSSLVPELDMLANVDAEGTPVSTARYLGGREFARLCEMTDCDVATDCEASDLARIIEDQAFAWPSFGDGSGPFGDRQGDIEGQPVNGKALATLYSALMLDQLLTNLGSTRDIAIEGSFAANDLLCSTLAALRDRQQVFQLRQSGGVVTGCFASMRPDLATRPDFGSPVVPIRISGLADYANTWRRRVMAHTTEDKKHRLGG